MDPLTYYPNFRRSDRVSKPPELFELLQTPQCLAGCADESMPVTEVHSANDSENWQEAKKEELIVIKNGNREQECFASAKGIVNNMWFFQEEETPMEMYAVTMHA